MAAHAERPHANFPGDTHGYFMTHSDGSTAISGSSTIHGLRAWWPVAVVVVFWAAEISLVQHWTTLPDADLPAAAVAKVAARRSILSLAACTAVVCVCRGWLLVALFAAWAVAANLLVVYATYFETPLSWPVVAAQWREGLAVSDAGVAMTNWAVVGLAVACLLLKAAVSAAIPHATLSPRRLRGMAAVAVCGYAAMAFYLAGIHKPLSQIRIGTPEYMYGYAVAWGAEMLLLDDDALLAEANDKARAKSDVLEGVRDSFAPGRHMAVIQVESLDFAALDARVDGRPVMPFLRELRDVSMLYSVKPFHDSGSSEADFSLLMAATPIGRFNPFQVAGFSYAEALPRLARERGYRPVALHGNTGSFFHRRGAYEQMGFDELFFREELAPRQVAGDWDDQLLAFSATELAKAAEPTLHFLITITSHTPFTRLPREKRELFPEPKTTEERYLNSIRYVDRALERYVAALPHGTTVVIYGDHESGVRGYAANSGHDDRVPWIIHEKGRDLSARQPSRASGLALSGELTQLDMACFLRAQIDGVRPAEGGPNRRGTLIAREPETTIRQ